ncbi:MAG: eukaryotic-like serine/threonine-protein kinase [Thermoleophilales bacterium]|nr:eukaryotic-like serine/threonine-protein kinase [Thermoleophilales bacterium]
MKRALWGMVLALSLPAAADGAESNGRLAFSQDERIATMRGDGSEVADLGAGTQPDWSPDGTRIAFVRGTGDSRIWAMAPDGSDLRPLTPRPRSGFSDFSPDWSPDGTRLAFLRVRDGDDTLASRLVVRDLATGRERVLLRTGSKDPSFVIDAAWSPDGGQLAYTRLDTSGDELKAAIHVIDVATRKSRRLVADAGLPAWSPDGSRIAFTSLVQGGGCNEDVCEDIRVVGADGTGDTALVTGAGVDEGPAWSPDGGSIVFQSTRNFPSGSNDELYAVRPDGSCLTWLTNGVAESETPDWQPGSGGVPDSLGCGAVGRQPAGLANPRGFGWWPGAIAPGNMMPSPGTGSRLDGSHYFSLIYDDCAAFDPGDCGGQFEVQNDSTCNRNPLESRADRRGTLSIVRGTLALGSGAGSTVDVYAGDITVTLFANDASNVSALIDALRPLDWARPVGNLPPPRFPRTVLRRIDEARRAGSAAALRKRGLSRGQARYLIRLARAVEPLQPLRAVAC